MIEIYVTLKSLELSFENRKYYFHSQLNAINWARNIFENNRISYLLMTGSNGEIFFEETSCHE